MPRIGGAAISGSDTSSIELKLVLDNPAVRVIVSRVVSENVQVSAAAEISSKKSGPDRTPELAMKMSVAKSILPSEPKVSNWSVPAVLPPITETMESILLLVVKSVSENVGPMDFRARN